MIKLDACFLSLDTDKPLGIWCANEEGFFVVDLEKFLSESLIDMGKVQRARYAERLQSFVDELKT